MIPAMQMSVAAWIAIGVGVIGVALGLFLFVRPRRATVDPGSVSEQWIAHQRAGRES
jgi:hypothetical protein